ncbi:constituent protein [Pseudomonas phage K5]|nr:constituent protein [Pseudomonas phage K8]YP_009273874.1 constituent protein [Pseudomonas phage K5]ALF51441.1 constituent protein [Pseudomonas phage K8]AMD42938.1 constituent protein [Pseudomonas phage K5]WQZ01274.1 metallophosphoesterase [Pseudomonas phage Pae01]
MSSKKHFVISDTQCKPGINLDYMEAIGKYIVAKRPDVVIHIGDHFDLASLSSYDKGKRSSEGRRYSEDVQVGREGLDRLFKPLWELQERQRANRKKVYQPRLIFTLGNHEERADRAANDNPELYGTVGSEELGIQDYGFEVVPFLKPIEVDGIYYVHYLQNHFTGKPLGGTANNMLKAAGHSFVMGHRQLLDWAIHPTIDGKQRLGIVTGACYPHDEAYKGYQGNNHFRGCVMIHEVKDGFGLPMPVSLDFMMEKGGFK